MNIWPHDERKSDSSFFPCRSYAMNVGPTGPLRLEKHHDYDGRRFG